MVSTLYQEIEQDLFDNCKRIKLVVFDVDGVFSDGQIYMGNNGEELKAFNTLDGYGVKALASCGITAAVITGRKSNIVEQRMRALNIKHILQGREDKQKAMVELLRVTGYQKHQVASMGDDLPDLHMFSLSQLTFAPANAHPIIKQNANYHCTLRGGDGAVREVCDLFLQAHGRLETIAGASI